MISRIRGRGIVISPRGREHLILHISCWGHGFWQDRQAVVPVYFLKVPFFYYLTSISYHSGAILNCDNSIKIRIDNTQYNINFISSSQWIQLHSDWRSTIYALMCSLLLLSPFIKVLKWQVLNLSINIGGLLLIAEGWHFPITVCRHGKLKLNNLCELSQYPNWREREMIHTAHRATHQKKIANRYILVGRSLHFISTLLT